MAIKTIPLSRLEMDLRKALNECVESGQTLIVEMPDHRLLTIQTLDPQEDDALMDEMLAANPKFQALVAKSTASPRKPFAGSNAPTTPGWVNEPSEITCTNRGSNDSRIGAEGLKKKRYVPL